MLRHSGEWKYRVKRTTQVSCHFVSEDDFARTTGSPQWIFLVIYILRRSLVVINSLTTRINNNEHRKGKGHGIPQQGYVKAHGKEERTRDFRTRSTYNRGDRHAAL